MHEIPFHTRDSILSYPHEEMEIQWKMNDCFEWWEKESNRQLKETRDCRKNKTGYQMKILLHQSLQGIWQDNRKTRSNDEGTPDSRWDFSPSFPLQLKRFYLSWSLSSWLMLGAMCLCKTDPLSWCRFVSGDSTDTHNKLQMKETRIWRMRTAYLSRLILSVNIKLIKDNGFSL